MQTVVLMRLRRWSSWTKARGAGPGWGAGLEVETRERMSAMSQVTALGYIGLSISTLRRGRIMRRRSSAWRSSTRVRATAFICGWTSGITASRCTSMAATTWPISAGGCGSVRVQRAGREAAAQQPRHSRGVVGGMRRAACSGPGQDGRSGRQPDRDLLWSAGRQLACVPPGAADVRQVHDRQGRHRPLNLAPGRHSCRGALLRDARPHRLGRVQASASRRHGGAALFHARQRAPTFGGVRRLGR